MDTPRQVAEKLVTGISERRFDDVAKLYAEDCVVEVPYAAAGAQPRIEGSAAIREHFARADAMPFRLRTHDLGVHETEDPELVVSEWDYEVSATAGPAGWPTSSSCGYGTGSSCTRATSTTTRVWPPWRGSDARDRPQ